MAEHELTAVVTVPVLLSTVAVGQVLGCSPRTVRRRIADGSLPAVTEHERVMVRGDDLRAYIDSLERVGPARPRRRAPRGRVDYSFLTD